jgi:hypothetical protein
MKAFLLLVTTQVTFSSMEACETARLQVFKDAERMRQEALDRLRRESQNSGRSCGHSQTERSTICAFGISSLCGSIRIFGRGAR